MSRTLINSPVIQILLQKRFNELILEIYIRITNVVCHNRVHFVDEIIQNIHINSLSLKKTFSTSIYQRKRKENTTNVDNCRSSLKVLDG